MIVALIVAVLAVVTFPFVVESFRPRMTKSKRKLAPGKFAKLSQGTTHYRWHGPEDGPVAVCVHGLTTPSYVYDGFAKALVALGFRVLVYDLYGRGFSDRPKGDQNSAFFLCQLDDLLADQKVADGFTLFGYSMGGAIAAAFAARSPERLKQVVLLAPAGMKVDLGPLADMANKYDFFGKWMTLGFYSKSLRRATMAERDLPGADPAFVDKQIAETYLKGFAPAVLSSLRGILDEDFEDRHRAIADSGLAVSAVWGETDDVIPLSCMDRLKEWNPDALQHVVPGAGHTVTYTHTDQVIDVLRPALTAT